MSDAPIGVFDSGVGGLTVMREVMKLMPYENIVYFGDTARVPYGNKGAETIIRYALEIGSFLQSHHVKMLVVACNTASSYAIEVLKRKLKIPVIGVIEAGAAKAAATTINQRIAVLGTRATIQSKAYQIHIQGLLPKSLVLSIACPLFVPLVEEGFQDHPSTHLIVQEYLKDLHHAQIDTLLLGCTHYPFLSSAIQSCVGSGVTLIDSSQSCAEHIKKILDNLQINAPLSQKGIQRYYVSDNPTKFCEIGAKLLDVDLKGQVEHCFRKFWTSNYPSQYGKLYQFKKKEKSCTHQ